MKKLGLPLLGLMAALVLTGCATVGETGRSQLMLVSPAQEMELGLVSFEQLKREMPVSRDPQINAMVNRVGQRIAAVSNLENAQWEFVVFDNPEPNAFALPGGKVGIHTGILQITQTEAGLATVIGHEVAHVAARHGAERMSEGIAMQLGGQVLGAFTSAYAPEWQNLASMVYGTGATLGRALPHNRAQESEADHIGLLYMARAGYDPREAVEFWKRFAAFGKKSSGVPWFLRTHPVDDKRIEDLRRWLPEATEEYRTSALSR